MNKQLSIGVDLDGTLADYQNTLFKFLKSNKLTNASDIKRDDCYDILGSTLISRANRLRKFYKSTDKLKAIPPVKGSQPTIKKLLSEGHELYIVTSRFRGFSKSTKIWLADKYGANAFNKITFSPFLSTLASKFKASKYSSNDVSLVIEDSPAVAQMCASKGMQVILLDYPWNRGLEHPNITRVKGWNQVPAVIKGLNL